MDPVAASIENDHDTDDLFPSQNKDNLDNKAQSEFDHDGSKGEIDDDGGENNDSYDGGDEHVLTPTYSCCNTSALATHHENGRYSIASSILG